MNDLMKGLGRVCLGSLAGAALGAASFLTIEALMPKTAQADERRFQPCQYNGGKWVQVQVSSDPFHLKWDDGPQMTPLKGPGAGAPGLCERHPSSRGMNQSAVLLA